MTHTMITCALLLLLAQGQQTTPKHQRKAGQPAGKTFIGTVVQEFKTSTPVLLLDTEKDSCRSSGTAAGIPYYPSDCVHHVYKDDQADPTRKQLFLGNFNDHIKIKGHYCTHQTPHVAKSICDAVIIK